MNKLMMVVAMLGMTALIAIAPVLAAPGGSDKSADSAPGKGSDAPPEVSQEPLPKVIQEPLPKDSPPQEAILDEAPPQEAPPKEIPVDEAPPKEIPVDEAPPKEAPLDEAPPKEIPFEEPLPKDTPPEIADQDSGVDEAAEPQQANASDDREEKVGNQKATEAKQGVGGRQDRDGDEDDDENNDDDDNNDDEDDSENGGVDQDIGQEAESGDIGQSVDVSNSGDYVNQCVAVLQNANTGNSQNAQGAAQYDSESDDIEAEGNDITVTPQLIQDCRQVILQITQVRESREPREARELRQAQDRIIQVIGRGSSAAGGRSAAGGGGGERVTSGRIGVGQPAVGLVRTGGAQSKASTPNRLPRTGGFSGGDAALLGLSAGALITAGGLLVRKTSR